jgi:hypothetical protein
MCFWSFLRLYTPLSTQMRSASLYTSLSTEVDGLSVFFSQFLGKNRVMNRIMSFHFCSVCCLWCACLCLSCVHFVVCVLVCVFLVGLCAPWLMHDMLPRVVEFGLIARPFLLVPPFDFSCLSAIFCNTVKYNVLAPFWSCLHPDLHAPAFLWLTADRIRLFLGGRSRPNIIALIPLQLTHFWAHYKFDMIAVAWTVAH